MAALIWPAIGWLWLVGLTVAGLFGAPVRRHHFESAGIAFGVGLAIFLLLHRLRRNTAAPGSASRKNTVPWPVILVPVAATMGAYAWTVGLGLLSDDFPLFRLAAEGRWAPETWVQFRPLPMAAWNVIAAAGGGPATLHLLNLVIHATNGVLVACLATRLGGNRAGAIAGLTFALVPSSIEAVAWASGIFDLMAAMFVLLAVVVSIDREPSLRTALVAMLASLAACLSKESAVAVPLLVLVTVLFGPGTGTTSLAWRLLAPAGSALVAVLFAALRAHVSSSVAEHLGTLPADRRAWKDMLVKPFSALAAPIRSESGLTTSLFLLGLALLVLVAVALVEISRPASRDGVNTPRRQISLVALGMCWIMLGALPLLSQLFLAPTLEGGRYLYLPAVGLALLVAAAFAGRRPLPLALSSVCLVVLLAFYARDLRMGRQTWLRAGATRDALLSEAEHVARTVPCRSLTVRDAPDQVRGAFVFRLGLADALRAVPTNPGGIDCAYRWDGAALRPDSAPSPR